MQQYIEVPQEAVVAQEELAAGDAARLSPPVPEPTSVIIPKMTLTARSVVPGFGTRKSKTYKYIPQDGNIPETSSADTDITKEVRRYATWLAADAWHNSDLSDREETSEYIDEAFKTVKVGENEARPFAPFQQTRSALRTLTSRQAAILGVVGFVCALGLLLYSTQTLVILIALATVFYLTDLLLNFLLSLSTLGRSAEQQIDDAVVHALADAVWPRYTILCPLYHEAGVVSQFVGAMQALDYPTDKLQILFLTEQHDVETRSAIERLSLPRHYRIVTVPDGEPRTKPRACNFGLLQATGDYVVIYDAEDVPDPLQLKKAVLTFANHGQRLACVQAKLNFYNTNQNLLTRWFTAEYSSWFDLILPGLQRVGLSIPLGGTSNHFRTALLGKVGGWDAFNVTEDCDLGLRLAHYHLETAIVDSTTYEEANSELKNWMRQRSRWIKGYMQTYLVHMRHPQRFLRPGNLREFLSLQLVVGGKTMVLFVNPLMWALVLIYILFHFVVSSAYHVLFPQPVLYMGAICLIFGNFFYLYIHLVGCLKRGQYGLIKWTLLIPIYWAMSSLASFISLYQLIFIPHYWEKTKHGLHLNATGLSSAGTQALAGADASEVAQRQPTLAMAETLLNTPVPETIELAEKALEHPALAVAGPLPDTPVPEAIDFSGDIALDEDDEVTEKRPVVKIDDEVTEKRPVVKMVRSLRGMFRSVETTPLPAFHLTHTAHKVSDDRENKTPRSRRHQTPWNLFPQTWRLWREDPWLIATLVTACAASVISLWYFFQNHEILLYGDSYSHLLIARRIIDSTAPGIAQVGGVWLPLPHLLMLPFIWNDYLWHTGLAGSFVSMPCYVISAIYLFLAARRLTHKSFASYVGTLLFILNPNILYLQTTPLSELVLIVTLTMTCYYFLAWIQDDRKVHLIWAAGSAFLATMARYDGWFLFVILLVLLVLIGLIKRQPRRQIEGNFIVFAVLGGLGIGLWLLWCTAIFGDPLYWQHSAFSSQAQQIELYKANLLYTYHDLWQSIHAYLLDSIENLGSVLFVLGVLALVLVALQRRPLTEKLLVLAFLMPFAFYLVSLYGGQAAIFVPGAAPAHSSYQLFNTRYGVQAIPPAAILLAILASRLSLGSAKALAASRSFLNRLSRAILRFTGPLLLIAVIVVQSILVARGGIISLQEGLFGVDCVPTHPTIVYLTEHYAGGKILQDTYSTTTELASDVGVDFKNVVYEGSGDQWNLALISPASVVDWIIMNPSNQNDLVAQHINPQDPLFLSQFTLVVREPSGLSLFHRNGLPPLPTRPVPDGLLTAHSQCDASLSGLSGQTGMRFSSGIAIDDTLLSYVRKGGRL